MTWILAFCTASWALCGVYKETEYLDEKSCYKAMEETRKNSATQFKYMTCSPKVKP